MYIILGLLLALLAPDIAEVLLDGVPSDFDEADVRKHLTICAIIGVLEQAHPTVTAA